jgi:hypothetical protein
MKDESTISQNPSITTKCNVDKRNKRNTNSTTVLWNILFRIISLIFSIQFTVYWYHLFLENQSLTKAIGYTLIFICGVVLLSDIIIDDEETD